MTAQLEASHWISTSSNRSGQLPDWIETFLEEYCEPQKGYSTTFLDILKSLSTNLFIHFWFSRWLNLSGPSCVYIFPRELIQRWTGQNPMEISFMKFKHAALFANHILWKESPSQKLSHPFLLLVKFHTRLQLQNKWVDCSPHRDWIYPLLSVLNHYINEFSELIDEVPESFRPGFDSSLCHIEYLTLHKATHIW